MAMPISSLETCNPNDPLGDDPALSVIVLDEGYDSIPFERISCPDLVFIAQCWLAMPRDEESGLPRWTAFRHAEFVSVLDKFCVLKVIDWRNDALEFSLYGGHPTEMIGRGRPLVMSEMRTDPLRAANYRDIRDRTGRAVENRAPQYARKTLSWDERDYIEYEALMLPFHPGADSQRVLQPVSAAFKKG
jgi:hypothetical protein